MIFILTGDIQTGKTRWLSGVVERLVADGVRADGVLAPGVWVEHAAGDGVSYEKTGIDNVLLPGGERISFARRRDLAERDGVRDTGSQSAAARLGWAIDDAAIAQVNTHFRTLAAGARDERGEPGLLVVDELGRLELERGAGLADALALLDRGATEAYAHALVVVRAGLLDVARDRLDAAGWGGARVVAPGDEAERALRDAFGLWKHGETRP